MSLLVIEVAKMRPEGDGNSATKLGATLKGIVEEGLGHVGHSFHDHPFVEIPQSNTTLTREIVILLRMLVLNIFVSSKSELSFLLN